MLSSSYQSDEIHVSAIVKNTKQHQEKDAKNDTSSASASGSAPTAPLEVWIFPLQWLERWSQDHQPQLLSSWTSPRPAVPAEIEERKRGFVRKKNKSTDHLSSPTESSSSKLQKMLGQDADSPLNGVGGNKKLLQVLGADVLIRDNNAEQRRRSPKLRKSDKKLSAKILKASRFVQLNIPEALTNKFALLTKTILLSPGLTASLYRNSGSHYSSVLLLTPKKKLFHVSFRRFVFGQVRFCCRVRRTASPMRFPTHLPSSHTPSEALTSSHYTATALFKSFTSNPAPPPDIVSRKSPCGNSAALEPTTMS
jgi:hypothetical protein